MKKIIFALLIFTSCAVKKPSVEQIQKLNYNDLPNYKQNEFGKEWYKDNPCATAFGTIGRDTITSIVYDYSALRALEDSIDKLQTSTINYLNNNKEISTKYNECNEVLSKCIKNLIDAKKTGFKTKTITIVDTLYDVRLNNILKEEINRLNITNAEYNTTIAKLENSIYKKRIFIWALIFTNFLLLYVVFRECRNK